MAKLNNIYINFVPVICAVIISVSDCLNPGSLCKTPNQEDGVCKSLYSCGAILDGIATKNPIALKFAQESNCGCDQSGQLVCCGTRSTYVETATKTTTERNDPKSLLPSKYICGRQSKDDRIETRNNTQIDEYPWMAVILRNESEYLCTGALINRRYILTAAHCLVRPAAKSVHVRLGEYDTSTNGTDCIENPDYDECTEPPIDFDIEETILHERYRSHDNFNDIALIRLNKDIRYSDYIRPICLPDETSKLSKIGDNVTTSGWGLHSVTGNLAVIKKNSISKRISLEECKEKYSGPTPLNQICVINLGGGGACRGDSGSPLMSSYKYQWTMEGLIASGRECGLGSITVAVYIPDYMDWILSKLKP